MGRVITIALSLFAIAGCGDDATTPEPPQDPQTGPLVTYSRGGGVAAVDEQLRVERDGAATVIAGYGPTEPQTFQIGEDELALLESELDAADFEAIDPGPTGCADCFIYEVTYDANSYSYDDVADPPQSVLTAVGHLGQLTADHYPPPTQPTTPQG